MESINILQIILKYAQNKLNTNEFVLIMLTVIAYFWFTTYMQKAKQQGSKDDTDKTKMLNKDDIDKMMDDKLVKIKEDINEIYHTVKYIKEIIVKIDKLTTILKNIEILTIKVSNLKDLIDDLKSFSRDDKSALSNIKNDIHNIILELNKLVNEINSIKLSIKNLENKILLNSSDISSIQNNTFNKLKF